jgi:hypothetical protein
MSFTPFSKLTKNGERDVSIFFYGPQREEKKR